MLAQSVGDGGRVPGKVWVDHGGPLGGVIRVWRGGSWLG